MELRIKRFKVQAEEPWTSVNTARRRDDCWISGFAYALLDTEKRRHGWATCEFNIVQLEISVLERTGFPRIRKIEWIGNRGKGKIEVNGQTRRPWPKLDEIFLQIDHFFARTRFLVFEMKRVPCSRKGSCCNYSRLNFLLQTADSVNRKRYTGRTLSNSSCSTSNEDK